MKSIFSLLACIFGISFLLGCAETDSPVAPETDSPVAPETDSPVALETPENDGPFNRPTSGYPNGWVKVTDEDVEELRNLDPPPNWPTLDISLELKKKYTHNALLKQIGDIPAVRYIIEFERNPGFEISREMYVAYFEAHYHIFPTENNRRVLEKVRNIENQPQTLEEDE